MDGSKIVPPARNGRPASASLPIFERSLFLGMGAPFVALVGRLVKAVNRCN